MTDKKLKQAFGEPRDKSFLEKINEINRNTWEARGKWVDEYKDKFPDDFREAVDEFVRLNGEQPLEKLLLDRRALSADDLFRELGRIEESATMSAERRRGARKASAEKSAQNSQDRERAYVALRALLEAAPIWRRKSKNSIGEEMLRRGENGESGGITGIKKSTLRGYIGDALRDWPVSQSK